MDVRGLIQYLANIQNTNKGSVLVLGFKGTQALTQHSPIEKLIEDITSPVGMPQHKINTEWQKLPSGARENILRKHTRPTDVDDEAVDCIAWLVQNRYIHAILATDPDRGLFDALQHRGVSMSRLDCATQRLECLLNWAENFRTKPIFVDGADLITFLEPSYAAGLMGDLYGKALGAVRDILSIFDNVISWGWCKSNLHFSLLWSPKKSSHLFILGDYSYTDNMIIPGFSNIDVIDDPSGNTFITTSILKEIGENLPIQKASLRKRPRARAVSSTLSPEDIRVVDLPSCLLWKDATCANIVEQILKSKISVIGVEGGVTRTRLARRVISYLRDRGKNIVLHHYANLPDMTPYTRRDLLYDPESWCLVGVLCDHFDHATLYHPSLVIDRWITNLSDSGVKAALFGTVELAEWMDTNLKADGVSTRSLFARNCMNKDYIRECIVRLLEANLVGESLGQEDVDIVDSVAGEILKLAGPPNDQALDRLHGFFDLWCQTVCREVRLGMQTDQPVILREFDSIHNELWKRYQGALSYETDFEIEIKQRPTDFEIGIKQRPEDQGPDTVEDFELGEIKEITKEADEETDAEGDEEVDEE